MRGADPLLALRSFDRGSLSELLIKPATAAQRSVAPAEAFVPFPKDTLASIEPSAAQERCPIPRTMDRIRGGGWCLLVLVAETINTWITVSSPWAARLRRHGGSRPWLLFEWDDHNNIHELPPGTDPGGRVGVGNTISAAVGKFTTSAAT